ncbi:hypothetical protein TCAL_15126 [Tigriopus californicus]|uniref:Uncharacterized protein n=1 Tax=Tigriopus californicus TaxID=6832 RepID=A0A553NUI3_TIGCA|nr:hypothetical protein TCAL_15126 [Tigriopus californicus]
MPGGPGNPCIPCGPGEPRSPIIPVAPVSPTGPGDPGSPCAPGSPDQDHQVHRVHLELQGHQWLPAHQGIPVSLVFLAHQEAQLYQAILLLRPFHFDHPCQWLLAFLETLLVRVDQECLFHQMVQLVQVGLEALLNRLFQGLHGVLDCQVSLDFHLDQEGRLNLCRLEDPLDLEDLGVLVAPLRQFFHQHQVLHEVQSFLVALLVQFYLVLLLGLEDQVPPAFPCLHVYPSALQIQELRGLRTVLLVLLDHLLQACLVLLAGLVLQEVQEVQLDLLFLYDLFFRQIQLVQLFLLDQEGLGYHSSQGSLLVPEILEDLARQEFLETQVAQVSLWSLVRLEDLSSHQCPEDLEDQMILPFLFLLLDLPDPLDLVDPLHLDLLILLFLQCCQYFLLLHPNLGSLDDLSDLEGQAFQVLEFQAPHLVHFHHLCQEVLTILLVLEHQVVQMVPDHHSLLGVLETLVALVVLACLVWLWPWWSWHTWHTRVTRDSWKADFTRSSTLSLPTRTSARPRGAVCINLCWCFALWLSIFLFFSF